jgi:hypothetical protein
VFFNKAATLVIFCRCHEARELCVPAGRLFRSDEFMFLCHVALVGLNLCGVGIFPRQYGEEFSRSLILEFVVKKLYFCKTSNIILINSCICID